MNTEYRRAIADAVARIAATTIVDGESPEKMRQAIAERVADLGKPSAADGGAQWMPPGTGLQPSPGHHYRLVGAGDGNTYAVS